MKVLVTGSTGFIGAHTAVALHRRGHDLRLLVRNRAKAEHVARTVGFPAAEIVVGDVVDAAVVARAVSGCDAVVHAAGAVSLDPRRAREAMAVNGSGSGNVLRGAADAGARRIIHVSSTAALQVTAGEPLTASAPISNERGVYGPSKAAAELVARELQAAGAPVTITYPSATIGPAAAGALGEPSRAMARIVGAGVLPSPRAALAVLDVRDLAELHCRVVEHDAPPDRVMCAGTNLGMDDLQAVLRRVTGRRFPILPLPAAALRGLGWLGDRVAPLLRIELPLGAEAMAVITGWRGSIDDVERLGVVYRPADETLEDSVDAWLGAGLVTPRQAGAVARRTVLTTG